MTTVAPTRESLLRRTEYLSIQIDRDGMEDVYRVTLYWPEHDRVRRITCTELEMRMIELAAEGEPPRVICELLHEEFESVPSGDEIAEEINRMVAYGLLERWDGRRWVRAPHVETPWRKQQSWMLMWFPVMNPAPLLRLLNAVFGWLFSTWIVAGCLAVIVAGAVSLFVNFHVLSERLPKFHEFFALENWLLIAGAILVTKVLHELGHGIVALREGVVCKECGIMFRILIPCFYMDLSDNHQLPNRGAKIRIMLAGIYVELVLAALATLWWANSAADTSNYVALAIMFSASVNTLLFNANPFMRFDGHYVLAYATGRNELGKDASKHLRSKLAWFFGGDGNSIYDGCRDRAWLLSYGAAAGVFRWYIALVICLFLYRVGEPYGLGVPVAMIGIWSLAIKPLISLVQFIRQASSGQALPAHALDDM